MSTRCLPARQLRSTRVFSQNAAWQVKMKTSDTPLLNFWVETAQRDFCLTQTEFLVSPYNSQVLWTKWFCCFSLRFFFITWNVLSLSIFRSQCLCITHVLSIRYMQPLFTVQSPHKRLVNLKQVSSWVYFAVSVALKLWKLYFELYLCAAAVLFLCYSCLCSISCLKFIKPCMCHAGQRSELIAY